MKKLCADTFLRNYRNTTTRAFLVLLCSVAMFGCMRGCGGEQAAETNTTESAPADTVPADVQPPAEAESAPATTEPNAMPEDAGEDAGQ